MVTREATQTAISIKLPNVKASPHTNPATHNEQTQHQTISLLLLTYNSAPSKMSTPVVEGKKRKKGEMRKSPDYYDEEGDLEIISSDGVAFKLQAFHLQAAS